VFDRSLPLVLVLAGTLLGTSDAGAMTRDELTEQVAAGALAGTTEPLEADGLLYAPDPDSRVIPDLPGWRPVAPVSPEHFGALGDGRDETEALAAAFQAGDVRLLEDRTYGFTGLEVPPGTVVTGSNAVLRYVGENTRDVILEIGAGTRWDRLQYSAAAQTVRQKSSIVIHDEVMIGLIDGAADTQLDATLVNVRGDGVEIGQMRSRGFGRPLLVERPKGRIRGFRLGWHDFESIVRGIRMHRVSDFEIGGGRQAGRSPLALTENNGRNNLLLAGLRHGSFGPMDLADAPEHAIRFGGGDKAEMVSEDVTFAPLTIRRASASAIKINPGQKGRVRDVRFQNVSIVDPFWEIGETAKASHLIRISHADDITIAGGSVRREAADPVMTEPGIIFAIADSTNVEIGPFVVECCAKELVAFIENNDADTEENLGDIRGIRFRGLNDRMPGGMSDAPIRFKTCDISAGDISFEGLNLRQLRKRELIRFPKCKAEYGAIRVQGRIDEMSRKTFEDMPENVDFTADIEDGRGRRASGSRKAILDSMRN
jgi:hypothetical protein